MIKTELKNNKIKIGEILKNPEARSIIESEFPGLTKNPLINLYSGATLESIIKKFGKSISSEKLERLKSKLEKI